MTQRSAENQLQQSEIETQEAESAVWDNTPAPRSPLSERGLLQHDPVKDAQVDLDAFHQQLKQELAFKAPKHDQERSELHTIGLRIRKLGEAILEMAREQNIPTSKFKIAEAVEHDPELVNLMRKHGLHLATAYHVGGKIPLSADLENNFHHISGTPLSLESYLKRVAIQNKFEMKAADIPQYQVICPPLLDTNNQTKLKGLVRPVVAPAQV